MMHQNPQLQKQKASMFHDFAALIIGALARVAGMILKGLIYREKEIIDSESESEDSPEASKHGFDEAEFENIEGRDERVDYLLTARERYKGGLKMRDVCYIIMIFIVRSVIL